MYRNRFVWGLCVLFLFEACAGHMSLPFAKGRSVRPKILPRLGWIESMPSANYLQQVPAFLTILDTPHDYEPSNPGAYLSWMIDEYIDEDGVGDVPVHYIIDQKGGILAGRPVNTQGELRYGDSFFRAEVPDNHPLRGKRIDTESHILVLVLGDYSNGPMPEKQDEAMRDLIQWLMLDQSISIMNVAGFRRYLPDSANPGAYLYEHTTEVMLDIARARRGV